MLVLGVTAALGACVEPGPKAPTTQGVCYYMAKKGDETRFNELAKGVPDIEHCAAELERMRIRFAQAGKVENFVVGTYQGLFVFLTQDGIYTSDRFNGNRYLLLVRYGNSLVAPGAIQQPPVGLEQK